MIKGRYTHAELTAVAAVAIALGLCAACGGEAHQSAADASAGAGAGNAPDASTPDAQAGGGASAQAGACGSVRIPKEHRAAAPACPTARGSSAPTNTAACTNRAGVTCTKDADCTAGKNGRCFLDGDPCVTVCSYDECSKDSDCATGPCLCRSSGTDPSANGCLPSAQCRTDADCPHCEYCSPSYFANAVDCSPGFATYACHTANDECTDQSECGTDSACGYDAGAGKWGCVLCIPVPHL